MTPENNSCVERAYPYRTGWRVTGCSIVIFALLGIGGFLLVPVGWEKVQNGQLPLGIAFMVIGMFAVPMVLMAILSLIMGIRETVYPPLVRVTSASVQIPSNLRDESTPEETDDRGVPKPKQPPAHPEEIPFDSIQWVRREGPHNPGSDRLVIAHDLTKAELVIEQYMMRTADFDELESALRAAIPGAFAAAPQTPS